MGHGHDLFDQSVLNSVLTAVHPVDESIDHDIYNLISTPENKVWVLSETEWRLRHLVVFWDLYLADVHNVDGVVGELYLPWQVVPA